MSKKKKTKKVEESQEVEEVSQAKVEEPQESTEEQVKQKEEQVEPQESVESVKTEKKSKEKPKATKAPEKKVEYFKLGKTELSKEEDARVRELYKVFVGRRGHRVKRLETISQQDLDKVCRNGQFLLKLGNLAELLKK